MTMIDIRSGLRDRRKSGRSEDWGTSASDDVRRWRGDRRKNTEPVPGGVVEWVWTAECASGVTTAVYGAVDGWKRWEPLALAAGAEQTTTVTVPGAALGDFVVGVSLSVSLDGTKLQGSVSAPDTVTVLHQNGTGGAVNLAGGILRVRVQKH